MIFSEYYAFYKKKYIELKNRLYMRNYNYIFQSSIFPRFQTEHMDRTSLYSVNRRRSHPRFLIVLSEAYKLACVFGT